MANNIRFTIDQLEVLQAIDRTGSFAGASRELHRVPSAISYVVRTLEDGLNLQLFDRRKHRAELTPAGRRILEQGAALLDQARSMDALAVQIETGWEPELHIVVDGIIPMHPIIGALKVFREEQIPTRIRLDVEYQEGVPDRWESDEADLMICLDFEDKSGTLERTLLPELQLLRVVSPDHPLADIEDVSESVLQTFMKVVVRDSSPRYARNPKLPFGSSQHLTYLSDFHSKRLALLQGAGFGWMPRHLIEDDLKSGRLVNLHTQEVDEWTYKPELVYLQAKPLGLAGQRFVDVLFSSFKKTDV